MNEASALAMLLIVSRAGAMGLTCAQFAKAAWPSSKAKGAKASSGAGAVLAELRRAGLTRVFGAGRYARHSISEAGLDYLSAFERRQAIRPSAPTPINASSQEAPQAMAPDFATWRAGRGA